MGTCSGIEPCSSPCKGAQVDPPRDGGGRARARDLCSWTARARDPAYRSPLTQLARITPPSCSVTPHRPSPETTPPPNRLVTGCGLGGRGDLRTGESQSTRPPPGVLVPRLHPEPSSVRDCVSGWAWRRQWTLSLAGRRSGRPFPLLFHAPFALKSHPIEVDAHFDLLQDPGTRGPACPWLQPWLE